MSTSEKKHAVSDAGAWAMNVISSVGIIMANKQVMSKNGYDFRFGEIGSHPSNACGCCWPESPPAHCLEVRENLSRSLFPPLRFVYFTISRTSARRSSANHFKFLTFHVFSC